MPPGTQCLGSQRSGHSRWGISGVPSVTSSCQWPLSSAGGSQGSEGLMRCPSTKGWEWPGMVPGPGLRATFSSRQWSLKPRPWGGNGAVRATELQETASSFSSPVCWCVRRGRWRPARSMSGPWQPGHGKQRPMYNSSQKKTVAGPQGLPLPLRTSGRDSPRPWRKGPTRAP